jgi:hypothetical protein
MSRRRRIPNRGDLATSAVADFRAVVASLALQHGVPPETIRRALTRHGGGAGSGALGTLLDLLAEAGANRVSRRPRIPDRDDIPASAAADLLALAPVKSDSRQPAVWERS